MTDDAADTDTYALKTDPLASFAAPDLDYRPPMPKSYRPRIGLIGAGGISNSHLDAYKTAGWEVAAIWNRTEAKAVKKAKEFCPSADVVSDWKDLLANDDIDVVDITLPVSVRAHFISCALKAGKHVLSQKPFVEDLDLGEELVALAEENGVQLAVNQNGRWSPQMAWMREAVRRGLIGDVI